MIRARAVASTLRRRAAGLLGALALACGPAPPSDGPFAVVGRLADAPVLGLPAVEDVRLRAELRHAFCTRPGAGFSVPVDPEVERVLVSVGVRRQRAGAVRFAVYVGHAEAPALRTEALRREGGWQDFTVAVPRGTGSLRFESEPDVHGYARDRSACWGSVVFQARRDARPPSLVLLSLDTLGAATLGHFGHPSKPSPRIDGFLDESSSFQRAYVQFGNTLVSHRAIFGSRYPSRQDGRERPMAEILGDAGYLTLAVTENAYVGSGFGFARGFDRFVDGQGGPGRNIDFQRGAATFETADRWLDDLPPDSRFFLFVHTYEVHAPYAPTEDGPRALADSLTPGDDRVFPARHLTLRMLEHNQGRAAIPEADLERYRALHTGEVLQLDAMVGAFLDGLATRGLAEDTIVVLTSDHGEAFGEDGAVGHGTSLHGRILRVPLAFRWPGRIPPATRTSPAESVDILPTVLGLLDLPAEAGVDGRDLSRALLSGESPAEPGVAFAELEPRPKLGDAWTGPDRCLGGGYAVFAERFKLFRCLDPAFERLYDLEADPDEARDVAPAHPEAVARLGALLDDYRARAFRERPSSAPAVEDVLDEETREQLRALGYAP